MKHKLDNKGISLAMMVGLLLLLVTLTATINELVIRALRAAHQIEAADRAYLAAEAGIEDALYELSAYTAGYETPPLGDSEVRHDDFDDTLNWNNEWQIANTDINDCGDMEEWGQTYEPEYCGRIYEGQKLVINLFSNDAVTTGVGTNEINDEASVVRVLDFTDFFIRFRLPRSVVSANSAAFSGTPRLKIDNDGDYDGTPATLNEDGADPIFYPPNTCNYSGNIPVPDNDCDGKEDEDSPQDPVFLWKLIDDAGHFFEPLRGCKANWGAAVPNLHPSGFPSSVFCEETFYIISNEVFADLNEDTVYGMNETGAIQSLAEFLDDYASSANQLQLEILPVAPFQFINMGADLEKVYFPYMEYGITYDANLDDLSATYFSLRSDGYFQDFKQSITTNVIPRATTRLLDLTIIQQ